MKDYITFSFRPPGVINSGSPGKWKSRFLGVSETVILGSTVSTCVGCGDVVGFGLDGDTGNLDLGDVMRVGVVTTCGYGDWTKVTRGYVGRDDV